MLGSKNQIWAALWIHMIAILSLNLVKETVIFVSVWLKYACEISKQSGSWNTVYVSEHGKLVHAL